MWNAPELELEHRFDLRPTRKVDLVHEGLKAALIDGEWPPGSPLSVQELCQRFGVSKQPVMDALRRLQDAEFVEILPQIGVRVIDPNPTDVADFFLVFAVLEGVVFSLAAQRRSAEDLDRIRAAMAEMDLGVQVHGRTPQAHRELNHAVHRAIHFAARSPVATRAARASWDRSDFLLAAFHVIDRIAIDETTRRHAEIADAIEKSDAQAARELGEARILAVRRRVIQRMQALVTE